MANSCGGFVLALRGELGPANGWFSRARRLVDAAGADGVERGYVRLPELLEQVTDGRWEDVDIVDKALRRAHVRVRDAGVTIGLVHGDVTDVVPSFFRLPKPLETVMRRDERWYRLRRE